MAVMRDTEWRAMTAGDIASVAAISDAVHGRYTERAAVYAERCALYPAGCRVLAIEAGIAGYLICHPWMRAALPALNMMVGAIPAEADCLYLHDLALLPIARGTGAGAAAAEIAVGTARAAKLGEIRLVAVHGAEGFWASQGFAAIGGESGAPGAYGDEAVVMARSISG